MSKLMLALNWAIAGCNADSKRWLQVEEVAGSNGLLNSD
jgi:hypothetical protein